MSNDLFTCIILLAMVFHGLFFVVFFLLCLSNSTVKVMKGLALANR